MNPNPTISEYLTRPWDFPVEVTINLPVSVLERVDLTRKTISNTTESSEGNDEHRSMSRDLLIERCLRYVLDEFYSDDRNTKHEPKSDVKASAEEGRSDISDTTPQEEPTPKKRVPRTRHPRTRIPTRTRSVGTPTASRRGDSEVVGVKPDGKPLTQQYQTWGSADNDD